MAQVTPSTARRAEHVDQLNHAGPPVPYGGGHIRSAVFVDPNGPMNRETRRRLARARKAAQRQRRRGGA